ncbi:hypothetical protein COX03_02535 [Candidatus Woesebacteria bacterium CG22_combo_CG10-13_8_21_14_all_39_10]|uniref:Uncharacterized protein n=1 Tax=Candidatus Woesebacteria bacterium CG22_combo_CG10-13_8_21_14_all_39_10 TaxID=1975059 RepID=A0A2H0BIP7_9BACT|nr:MAG: hypothetical protein COX03_02535 [Candidatus Woesebacteria bacterium CG22_combo_CG10-13_8_21_14_all_39_10]
MFNFDLGKFSFSSSYIQAGVVVVLLFILILMLAQLRRYFVDSSVKGSLFGLFFGFLLALILEGFLIIGGKTAITQVLGWKEAPKPIANLLEIGRDELVQVLGEQAEVRIPDAVAKLNPTFNDAVVFFQSLNPSEAQKLKNFICKPSP